MPGDLEVVWPLHRSHYLSPALTDEGLLMQPEPESADDPVPAGVDAATPGRELGVRALLAGADCPHSARSGSRQRAEHPYMGFIRSAVRTLRRWLRRMGMVRPCWVADAAYMP